LWAEFNFHWGLRMSGCAARAALAGLLIVTIPATHALAHAVCGNRIFPPTLTMDDPGMDDEASLPTVQYAPIPASGGAPGGSAASYGFEYDKTLIAFPGNVFGVAINGDYITQRGAGENLNGWDNFSVTLKDQFYCNPEHEFMMSAGVVRDLGATGSAQLLRAGAIPTTSDTAPTWYVGKGFGDLPIGLLRAVAVTGEIGYAFSDSPNAMANEWDYAASIQYSMPYLAQHVRALPIPEFFNHLIGLVEFSYSAPTGGPTTGTIAPGMFYEGDSWQVGAEAVFPANAATRQSQGTGFIVQFHLFLDDIFPNSIGKPFVTF
jgi:hypothetical protein